MEMIKEIIIAAIQLITMVLLYPVLMCIVLRWKSDKYGFLCGRHLFKFRGKYYLYLFPGCGKWFLPIFSL